MEKTHLSLYDKFRTVPEEAKKKITGGRLNGFTDINPMWRIKKLTEEFGPIGIGWYYDILKQKLEKGANDEIAAFVKINLFVKSENEWSKQIQGIGGSMFVSKEKNGMYTSDECFKMALTDAISTSCKALGIGADVYFEKDRTKYDAKPEQPQSDAKTQSGNEPEKLWLNKWKDKEKTTVFPLYTKVLLNARNKSMTATDLKKYYKISKEVEKEIENDLN